MPASTTLIPGREAAGPSRDTPVWHPLARPSATYEHLVPVPGTICDPQCIGLDPDTGTPLTLRLWDSGRGGRVVAITSRTGAGQSTLLASINERITACPDTRLIQIRLARAPGARQWAPLAIASAVGRDTARAAQILRFSADAIGARLSHSGPARVHRPTPSEPLYVLQIENPGTLTAADPVACFLLGWITARCRTAGWAVILAAPRATAAALGGVPVMSSIDVAVTGPPPGQPGHSLPGVFSICEPPSGQPGQRGRGFWWGDRGDTVSAVVSGRLATRSPHLLEPALAGLQPQWDQVASR